jgi:hypothetical protein
MRTGFGSALRTNYLMLSLRGDMIAQTLRVGSTETECVTGGSLTSLRDARARLRASSVSSRVRGEPRDVQRRAGSSSGRTGTVREPPEAPAVCPPSSTKSTPPLPMFLNFS